MHQQAIMDTNVNGPYRSLGTLPDGSPLPPGRHILVVAAWRSEDRALRAMVTDLKELVPCAFETMNLENPTEVHYRNSSRALYERIRRFDAVVFAFSTHDGSVSSCDGSADSLPHQGSEALSPALRLPEGQLPFGRLFRRRIPAGYLVDGPLTPELMAAVTTHTRAWHLRFRGIATVSDLESLSVALKTAIR